MMFIVRKMAEFDQNS